jgi:predicted acylesterase/phospholipase RssA
MRIPALLLIAALAGCASQEREQRELKNMLKLRGESQQAVREDMQLLMDRLLRRAKAEHDAHAAGRRAQPPSMDILVISGGGDWGAFGAGFLKGWGRLPSSHPLARPQFDAVTGVSTGALIAPFAFIGSDEAIESIVQLYRNPKEDWVNERGILFFLPNNASFAEIPGLERELHAYVTQDMLRKIVEVGGGGRVLAVNTTNLDDGSPRVFDLVAEATRALENGSIERLHNIMLASSGIPAAFPHRMIEGEMYVDGGVTGNIVYGGRLSEEWSLPARWQQSYPGVPVPKMRFWVLFNNQVNMAPAVVRPRWPDIIARSMELSSRAATLTAMRHLYAMAEISRLKRKAEIEVRVVAVPDNWVPPVPGVFKRESMNALADLGEAMGADPSSWRNEPPP